MKKAFVTAALLFASLVHAEDCATTPRKKEICSLIPHVWLSGEFLMLRAKEDRFDFANQMRVASSSSFVGGTLNRPHFQWNPGVRVNFGYQPADWIFFGQWMFIQSKARGAKFTDGTKGFFPVQSQAGNLTASSYVTSALEDWRLNYNCVDAGGSYPWKPLAHFHVKPHAAWRVAFVDQTAYVNYGGGVFSGGMDDLILTNNYWGMGPSVGVMPVVPMGKGLSLVADVTGSLLLGSVFTKHQEQYLTQTVAHRSNSHTQGCWMLDWKAGLNWQTEPFYKALVLSVQAGWEWHLLYDQQQLSHNQFGFFSSDDGNDLFLQGGYVSLALGF